LLFVKSWPIVVHIKNHEHGPDFGKGDVPSWGTDISPTKVTFESMMFLFPFGGICIRSLETYPT